MSSWAHRACALHLWLRGSRCYARRAQRFVCRARRRKTQCFVVRIAMRPMTLDLVESRIVVSVFQFGLRLRWAKPPVAVAPWTFA